MNVDERIAKLPKWVKEHITTLERRAKKAELTLKEYSDDQTPSKVWYWGDLLSDSIHFVQSERITIGHADVVLDVNMYEEDQIQLSWRPSGRGYSQGDICFIPSSYQQARLVNPKNASL
jgi:hypothetical protein